MSQRLLEVIENIEQESQSLTEEYQQKISLVKREAEHRMEDAKKNMEISLREYEQELQLKNQQKLEVFRVNTKQHETETIAQLRDRYTQHEQDYIQATIKEVLLRYGNR